MTARPLKNFPFCPISAPAPWNAKPIPLGSDSNFNPRNTQFMDACPDVFFIGVVKFSPCLNLNKNEYFSKVSLPEQEIKTMNSFGCLKSKA